MCALESFLIYGYYEAFKWANFKPRARAFFSLRCKLSCSFWAHLFEMPCRPPRAATPRGFRGDYGSNELSKAEKLPVGVTEMWLVGAENGVNWCFLIELWSNATIFSDRFCDEILKGLESAAYPRSRLFLPETDQSYSQFLGLVLHGILLFCNSTWAASNFSIVSHKNM